ncbi:ABC transporter ATP-binding protein [Cognatazoarcus halotolerans]|uniref:ABC transporter ATP-binding protein n=1 Tax=Cognatazoarcus halotolerans TaxID=2686016 RepID=UPI00135CF627|nr:dipeptide ABC transporter ATP-binding protein [Cognatazoarcus halotolerans]
MTMLEELPKPAALAADLLAVRGLKVELQTPRATLRPVDGVSFAVRAGETFALLGESGCGKSMTALALMRLLPMAARIAAGQVEFSGRDLLARPEAAMREVRGGQIAMIFQEPSTSLNPVMTVFDQIAEVLGLHRGLYGEAARGEALRLLGAVGIPDPAERLSAYPFELSGGMKQRVMIAMALAGEPQLLIADEPTTALDVTIQAQVLEVLMRLQAERGMGMLLITHDLGVVSKMAHQVGVMYAGELVETGDRAHFFAAPLHPYSRKLFAALPSEALRGHALETLQGTVPPLDRAFAGCRFADRCPAVMARCHSEAPGWHSVDGQQVRCHLFENERAEWVKAAPGAVVPAAAAKADGPVLETRGLEVHFPIRKGLFKRVVGHVRAVDGVSLSISAGRTLALVGESGCGKTTVGKAILQLVRPTAGEVLFGKHQLVGLSPQAMKPHRKGLQMVFQDPFASLNPRMRIGDILLEGMAALKVGESLEARSARIDELLQRVGLDPAMRSRFPHEFSGGQRQRIAIARALAVAPALIVCDEPTSALDVSVQAQILNLLRELQAELGLSYLFITHNLAVVDYLAHDVAVMYLGRIVEAGPAEQVLRAPAHPYTRALLAAVPKLDGEHGFAAGAGGEIPSPINPPGGCHFHPRCPLAREVCRGEYPGQTTLGGSHVVHCHAVSEGWGGAH